MKDGEKTYSTSQIAGIVGLHPNTVRKYEEWGLLQTPERKPNGYRVYTDVHIKQFELAKKALQSVIVQAGLRKMMIDTVKLSARYQYDEAIELVERYIVRAGEEIKNAKEAAEICEVLCEASESGECCYKRAEAAKELGLTIDTIRNWEMNGLITVKRKQNGYRIYNAADMKRLKIIRSLRCANYSLTAILRMLQRLEEGMERTDIFDILNTPDEEDSIVSECDKLVLSLEEATQNAYEVKQLLLEIKEM